MQSHGADDEVDLLRPGDRDRLDVGRLEVTGETPGVADFDEAVAAELALILRVQGDGLRIGGDRQSLHLVADGLEPFTVGHGVLRTAEGLDLNERAGGKCVQPNTGLIAGGHFHPLDG